MGALMALAGLIGLLWDATRKPGEPWFRWLMPLGYCVMLVGLTVALAVGLVGVLIMSVGLGLTNYWRWTGRTAFDRKPKRKKPPPVFRPPKR